MVAGTVSAAMAIAPAWLGRGGALPGAELVLLLLAVVVVAGLLSSASPPARRSAEHTRGAARGVRPPRRAHDRKLFTAERAEIAEPVE